MALGKFSPGCNCCGPALTCVETTVSLSLLDTGNQPAGWTVDAGIVDGIWGLDDVVTVPGSWIGSHEAFSFEVNIAVGSFEFSVQGHTILIDADAGTVTLDGNGSIFLSLAAGAESVALSIYVTPSWIGVYVDAIFRVAGLPYRRGSVQVLDAVHSTSTEMTITAKTANSQLGEMIGRNNTRTFTGNTESDTLVEECNSPPLVPCTERLHQKLGFVGWLVGSALPAAFTVGGSQGTFTRTFNDPSDVYSYGSPTTIKLKVNNTISVCNINLGLGQQVANDITDQTIGLLVSMVHSHGNPNGANKYPKPVRDISASASTTWRYFEETSPGVWELRTLPASDTASGGFGWNATGQATATLTLSYSSRYSEWQSLIETAGFYADNSFGAGYIDGDPISVEIDFE